MSDETSRSVTKHGRLYNEIKFLAGQQEEILVLRYSKVKKFMGLAPSLAIAPRLSEACRSTKPSTINNSIVHQRAALRQTLSAKNIVQHGR